METTINDIDVEDVETINDKTPHKFSSPWHFSDVVLVVEGTKFHVHKCILSMWSPVFEKMFTSEFSERNAEEIPLPGKLAGSGTIIQKTNHEFLLELAREYQMDKVQEYCGQYMKQCINNRNCLHRYNIAERFGLEDVMEKCNEEARFKSSTDLEKSADFLGLGFKSKFKLCMARMKELEKVLWNYVEICSKLVSGYYEKIDSYGEVPNGVQCINKVAHEYGYKERVQKDFDSSCMFCRNRIGSTPNKSKFGSVYVNAVGFNVLFMQLYNLEHDQKVAKLIRKNMNSRF
ncbi:actin-binding protein IPP-like [Actinia tenebrosa]|uniref:Actin-binding protein IPP-like n=1 Tax=Actinia tenebrosa TaxID=6105 RepID=A0A6P8IHX9_ACTTE|nr:actin-binding protein IPP-like [Actinia tenebrosa]